jgi:hypothetical protein
MDIQKVFIKQAKGGKDSFTKSCYVYVLVGSDFNEASVGELKRSNDVSNKLQMSLPHSTSRKLAVRVSQSHMGRLVGQDEFSEGVLGITGEDSAFAFLFKICKLKYPS